MRGSFWNKDFLLKRAAFVILLLYIMVVYAAYYHNVAAYPAVKKMCARIAEKIR